MADIQPEYLDLIEPTEPLLNIAAEVVENDEISSQLIQGTIDRMLELSAGKGHSKHDSRQMVGLAAMQLGISKRIITIDVTADGSKKDQRLQVFINPKITHRSKSWSTAEKAVGHAGTFVVMSNVQKK